jgi:hypothetical protein
MFNYLQQTHFYSRLLVVGPCRTSLVTEVNTARSDLVKIGSNPETLML